MLVEDVEVDHSETSLAAALTRSRASFHDDTWVWGVDANNGQDVATAGKAL